MVYTDTTFKERISGGEVLLVHSTLPFLDRVMLLQDNNFFDYADTICLSGESMGIEDIHYAIDQIQKKSSAEVKVVFIVFDQMSLPAQNAFLKTLEDIPTDTCVCLYVSNQTTLLATMISRVVAIQAEGEVKELNPVFFTYKKIQAEQVKTKRLDMIKPIVKAYDDEKITKQDIVSWLSRMYATADKPESRSVISEAIVLMQQQSVLVKYVLEYMVVFV